MTSGPTTASAAPGRVLLQAAGAGRTGALVVDAAAGGTLYLTDGLVTHAESPSAPGVGELLTASGRLAPRTWQAAVDTGTSTARVGALLVEQGHLTRGELELCLLGAIYDAAYFVLRPSTASVEFVANATHWLGPVIRVDAAAIAREARRRGRLLDAIYPHPDVDTAPVTPAPRPPVERVMLNALQWELLMHADGQRTPADLAQLLGRAGYATVQELRRLARLGLLEPPASAVRRGRDPALIRLPRGPGPSVDVHRPAAPEPGPRRSGAETIIAQRSATSPNDPGPSPNSTGSTGTAPNGTAPNGTAPNGTAPNGTAPNGAERVGIERLARLPRRKPSAKLPKGAAAAERTGGMSPGPDEMLLKRIRTALRALR